MFPITVFLQFLNIEREKWLTLAFDISKDVDGVDEQWEAVQDNDGHQPIAEGGVGWNVLQSRPQPEHQR